MFFQRKALLSTLLALTLLIAFVDATPDANVNAIAHKRQANRMIKVRATDGGLLGIIGVGSDPTDTASSAAAATTTAASTSAAAASSSSSSASSSSSSSSSSSASTSSSAATTSKASTTSSSTSSSATSTSSSSSSSASSSTSSETLSVTSAPSETSNVVQGTLTSTITSAADNSATASQAASTQGATSTSSGISKTTITVIAVIGGSVVAALVLWTIIRKLKFRPSAEFEDRMQPIDWAPEASHASGGLGVGVGAVGGLNRSSSSASHGSFHSADSHGHGGYNTQPQRSLVSDIPQHDFTAGPAHLGVGNGYADLQRGPSPVMGQTAMHGASYGRGYGY